VSLAPRVLIVEDEPGLRLTLSDRLGSEGYAVETASDGEAGLARVTSGGYDVIVLDVMLPRMNGFDVCREARQRGVTTPILMLTARGQVTDKVVGLKLGADDYLTKPFETIELMARLEALLRRRPSAALPGGDTYRFGEVARCAAIRRVGLRRDAADADRRRPRRRPAAETRTQPPLARVHPHRPRPGLQVRRITTEAPRHREKIGTQSPQRTQSGRPEQPMNASRARRVH
jgi:CheY-like chemotaxis protein